MPLFQFKMNTNKGIAIALLGPGLVGQQVLRQISNLPESTVAYYGKFSVKAIANSTLMVLNFDSFQDQNEAKSCLADKGEPTNLRKLCSFLLKTECAAAVIIDCSSSELLAHQYPVWLSQGIHIVTPNKKAFSSKFELFHQIKLETLKRKVFCYYESAVGAGLPILDTLKNMIDSGDQVLRIEGILSGTISFIFNSFSSSEKSFSQIVNEAKQLGYTEPDPRDDLSGMDIARKTLILARMCGFKIEIDDIKVEQILPAGYMLQQNSISVEDFMLELVKCDQYFAALKENANKQSKVLKSVSTVDVVGKMFSICLKEFPKDHPFANVKGCDNVVSITTHRYKTSPLVIQGFGAGAEVTAAGVLADLLRLACSCK